ncbi:unnamed protein product [Owenia fusiformis]|uniref:Fucosyltransferase n=1 Tax=Owenia fusiformis TaxID=6347 RepID=A0A8J1UMG7_OWEFU|nr:unnamed protein product [Owenia fusiformis]
MAFRHFIARRMVHGGVLIGAILICWMASKIALQILVEGRSDDLHAVDTFQNIAETKTTNEMTSDFTVGKPKEESAHKAKEDGSYKTNEKTADNTLKETANKLNKESVPNTKKSQKKDRFGDDVKHPILLWWTYSPGKRPGEYVSCGNVKCYITDDKEYFDHDLTRILMFYGTDMLMNELPLPRHPKHEWGLLHNESPKNNRYWFSHPEIMHMFNYTSTFKRESDYPITTQDVEDIEYLQTKKYYIPLQEKNKLLAKEGLAPIVYVHSDCNVPSDRDAFVKALQKYIPVDAYGKCQNNKKMPPHIDGLLQLQHKDFFKLMAKYKFTLAMENAVCDDYVTEKFWRTIHLGSVPIYFGSPKIKDFLPNDPSAIIIQDYKNISQLADFIHHLNKNDEEYAKYMQHKVQGVTNKYLIDRVKNREWGYTGNRKYYHWTAGFECYACSKMHENLKREKLGEQTEIHQSKQDHYGCPPPKRFDLETESTEQFTVERWNEEYLMTQTESKENQV